MKKKIVYALVLMVAFLVSEATTGVMAADAPFSRDRSGLQSHSRAAAPSSSTSSEITRLRSIPGEPNLGDGVGMLQDSEAPVGDATGFILLSGLAYLGFVFLRKREESVKN